VLGGVDGNLVAATGLRRGLVASRYGSVDIVNTI